MAFKEENLAMAETQAPSPPDNPKMDPNDPIRPANPPKQGDQKPAAGKR